MIQFLRENTEGILVEATMNYNNDDTKKMVDFIQSTFGIEVSATRSKRGADLIYSKDQNPKTAFMIFISEDDTFYLVNATEKMMSDFVGNKRWKAANDKKNTAIAADGIVNKEVGKLINTASSQSQAHDMLTKWLNKVGITPQTTEVATVKSATPVGGSKAEIDATIEHDKKADRTIKLGAKKDKKTAKATTTKVLDTPEEKTDAEIMDEIDTILHNQLDFTDRYYGSDRMYKSPDVQRGKTPTDWTYASYKAPSQFQSRPGEEDDDFPDFVGYEKVKAQVDKALSQYGNRIETYVDGEEKGWISISVRVKPSK